MLFNLLYFSSLSLAFLNFSAPQPTNHLGISGPIVFQKNNYYLAWSAHPAATYYKHEYLTKGANPERYDCMILVEFLADEKALPKNLGSEKANSMSLRKKTDPYAHVEAYQSAKKPNEFMVDFMLSDAHGDEVTIVEWNVYRYVKINTKNGKKGVLLVALSRRAYGKAIPAFLANLKTQRAKLVSAWSQTALPTISIK